MHCLINVSAETMTLLDSNIATIIPQEVEAHGCVPNPNALAPGVIAFSSSKRGAASIPKREYHTKI
jgi:Ni,Fe-hydrogenase III small subunit